MEADISTLRKTGHFYFALTRRHAGCQTKCFVASGRAATAIQDEQKNRQQELFV
jgi:hypothetical protein